MPKLDEQCFYHSFPRWNKYDREKTFEDGLKILSQIFESGLLLASEVVKYPGAELTDIYQRRILSYPEFEMLQTRLCLTSLEASRLGTHMKEFGPITIEFTKNNVLDMGAIPVIYLPPKEQGSTKNLRNLASEILMFLHINAIMLKNANPNALSWPPNLQGLAPLSLMAMRDYMSPLFGFFYPTENKSYSKNYYEQREWRVVGLIAGKHQLNNDPLMISTAAVFEVPTTEEQEKIISINKKFWTDPVAYNSTYFRRIDKALFFKRVDGREVQTLIRKVVVPWRIYFRARAVIKMSRYPKTPVELYFVAQLKYYLRRWKHIFEGYFMRA